MTPTFPELALCLESFSMTERTTTIDEDSYNMLVKRQTYLSIYIDHVPGVLELPDVIVAEQSVFLVGVKQREVLHDDSCKQRRRFPIFSSEIRTNNKRQR